MSSGADPGSPTPTMINSHRGVRTFYGVELSILTGRDVVLKILAAVLHVREREHIILSPHPDGLHSRARGIK